MNSQTTSSLMRDSSQGTLFKFWTPFPCVVVVAPSVSKHLSHHRPFVWVPSRSTVPHLDHRRRPHSSRSTVPRLDYRLPYPASTIIVAPFVSIYHTYDRDHHSSVLIHRASVPRAQHGPSTPPGRSPCNTPPSQTRGPPNTRS